MRHYFYLANPIFGGWVTFSAHLLHTHGQDILYKIGNKTESKARDFGYDIKYQNITKESLRELKDKCILALDKHHYHLMPMIKDTTIIMHDTIEIKPDFIDFYKDNKIIVIRQQIKDYFKEKLDVDTEYKIHPFYPYPIKKAKKKRSVATSRIDWDKHTDIILEANKSAKNKVDVYGAINRLYEFHKLKDLNLAKYYKGNFAKSFNAISNILADAKFMVDLTMIKNDGGGTQYTFLEAIYQDSALILNRKWLENKGDFKEGYNCYAVSNAQELKEILDGNIDTGKITRNAKKLLDRHMKVRY